MERGILGLSQGFGLDPRELCLGTNSVGGLRRSDQAEAGTSAEFSSEKREGQCWAQTRDTRGIFVSEEMKPLYDRKYSGSAKAGNACALCDAPLDLTCRPWNWGSRCEIPRLP